MWHEPAEGHTHVDVRVPRLEVRLEERAQDLDLRECALAGVVREAEYVALKDVRPRLLPLRLHRGAWVQRRVQLDVRIDEVEPELRRAKVEAQEHRGEVRVDEREVLGTGEEVARAVDHRGQGHAEEGVRVVEDGHVPQRGAEPEVRHLVALALTRSRVGELDEAGEDGERLRGEAMWRGDGHCYGFRLARADGE